MSLKKSNHDRMCVSLVERCKHESKQLVEFTATRRKVHWTHPSFVSFCVSVEDILSYGVKRRYSKTKMRSITSSGRILQELGKTYPEASLLYKKCYGEREGSREDYVLVGSSSPADRKVLWIRAALVESKLQGVVEQLMKNKRQFYTEHSVLCHPVYGEIFQFLIDGPCAIRFSRLKIHDASLTSPSPAEIVQRHNQVLSLSLGQQEEVNVPTEAAWDHVRSLYQSSASICLFGKNSILVKPAELSAPLLGYLTLLKVEDTLIMKWIPNSLLQDASNSQSSLWKHVLSVDIIHSIAHLHCHRSPGCSAELILIGYDGIAYPPILFPHQPSLFLFLESLENSLLPQGCLEPPLWYLKTQASKVKASSLKRSGTARSKLHNGHHHGNTDEEGEWFDSMEVWNQVFRVRHSSPSTHGGPGDTEGFAIKTAQPPQSRLLPLNLTPYSPTADPLESSSSSDSEDELSPLTVTVEKPGSLARRDWEKFQLKVSKQLLARYFYSWLSYCRHMLKVRKSVAHMVNTDVHYPSSCGRSDHAQLPLNEAEWVECQKTQDVSALVKTIYYRGVEHDIRKQVWPFLLGVFPLDSTPDQRAAILQEASDNYHKTLDEWKSVEARSKEIERKNIVAVETNGHMDEGSGEISPALSSITATPPDLSPLDTEELSHDTADDSLSLELGSHDALSAPVVKLDAKGQWFVQELFNIDKDIPRCDRDYWYFQENDNLMKLRNVVCSYVWSHINEGYSQGMCDLLAPLLVVIDDESLVYICYLRLMESAIKLFPPNTGMNTRLSNLQALLQIMEPDYFQYLSDRPMGDGLFYCYRWLLVTFKREFDYSDVFRLWETVWAARRGVSNHFEEFFALAIMKQFKMAIMDAHLDPSDILNLFTDLAEKRAINCSQSIHLAQQDIADLQAALIKKDS